MQRKRLRFYILFFLAGVCLIGNSGCKKFAKTEELMKRMEVTTQKMEELTTRMEAATQKLEHLPQKTSVEKTIITASMEQEMLTGKNVLWCSTLQLAWNELITLAGGPIQMTDAPPLVALLNRQTANKADLDEGSYIAIAGLAGEDLRAKIEHAQQTFKDQKLAEDLGAPPPGSVVAYAYLLKTLPFEWAFKRFEIPFPFGATDVVYFGIQQYLPGDPNMDAVASQVVILDYRSANDFMLELKTRSAQDRLILAKISPQATLTDTISQVFTRVAQTHPGPLGKSETLAIPVIDIDRFQAYAELAGQNIIASNPAVSGAQFSRVAQRIRFKLDETGAILESEAIFTSSLSPRQFMFDQPFLVVLLRQGAERPYFAAWIANSEVLVPFDASK